MPTLTKTKIKINTALGIGIIAIVACGAAVAISFSFFSSDLSAIVPGNNLISASSHADKKCQVYTDMTGKKTYQGCDIDFSQFDAKSAKGASLKAKLMALPKDRQAELNYQLQQAQTAIAGMGGTWSAGWNEKSILSDAEKKQLNGLLGKPPILPKSASKSLIPADPSLPDFYDWRNVGGKNYITAVKNQDNCGSCLAFGADATFEGHIQAYYNNPNLIPDLAEQDLVSCAVPYPSDGVGGCQGAFDYQIEDIFETYWTNIGNAIENYFPYSASDSSCLNKLPNWETTAWKNLSYKTIPLTDNIQENIYNIKNAVIKYGPVEVGMIVYNDFFGYSGGIYQHTTDYVAGGHAVTIVGFDKDDGLDYWIVKNSWGQTWGEDGYFKIYADDSNISSWFAFAVDGPNPPAPQPVICTDNDSGHPDGYCYWGLGSKPATGCPDSCKDQTIEDCDDSNSAIYQGCGKSTEKIGALKVTANISEADVYVRDITTGNFVYRGKTPLETKLNIGEREIKISKQGYFAVIKKEIIEEGETKTIDITLTVEPKITQPMGNDIYKVGKIISLTGTIKDNIKSYNVVWEDYSKKQSAEGITLTNGGLSPIIDSVFAKWDTSGLSKGFYNLILRVNYLSGEIFEKMVVNIYLDPTLKKGWPQRIAYYIDSGQGMGSNSIFTAAKYYSVIENSYQTGNSSQNNSQQVKTITNTNKNSLGFYSINPGSFGATGGETTYWGGFLAPVVADINNDGKKEIIIYKGGNPPEVDVFNSNGILLWKKEIAGDRGSSVVTGSNLPMLIIGDINNDGKNEIIVFNPNFIPDGTNSILYALKNDGSILWKTYVPRDYQPTILMADLNKDGNKEIIIKGNSSFLRKMVIVNNHGTVISSWDLPKINHTGGIVGSPAVGNFDDDSDLEIVIAGPSENEGPVYQGSIIVNWINEGIISVYNMDGSMVSGWPRYVPGYIFSSPVVGDINNDGFNEIVVGLMYANDFCIFPCQEYGGLYAFDKGGNILPGWPVEKGWNFWSTPALGDVDNDGYLEISASKLGFETYLFRYDGSIMSGWPQTTGLNDYYGSIIGDINSDGKLDILTTAGTGFYSYYDRLNDGGVYAWNRDGSMIAGFPKVTDSDAQAPAVIDDIDNDGKVELIASSDWDYDFFTQTSKKRGSIYVWDLDAPYNAKTMPWPMFQHDTQHTGLYTIYPAIKDVTLSKFNCASPPCPWPLNATSTVSWNFDGVLNLPAEVLYNPSNFKYRVGTYTTDANGVWGNSTRVSIRLPNSGAGNQTAIFTPRVTGGPFYIRVSLVDASGNDYKLPNGDIMEAKSLQTFNISIPSISNVRIGDLGDTWPVGVAKYVYWDFSDIPTEQGLKYRVSFYSPGKEVIFFYPVPLDTVSTGLKRAKLTPSDRFPGDDYTLRVLLINADGTDYLVNGAIVEAKSLQIFKCLGLSSD